MRRIEYSGRGRGGPASNLYNIISIHSEKNVGWILHEDNNNNDNLFPIQYPK